MVLTLVTNSSYTAFLTASFFTTLFHLLKLRGVVSNLSISYLLISHFMLPKSVFLVNFGAAVLVAFFKSSFVAQLDKPNSTFFSFC